MSNESRMFSEAFNKSAGLNKSLLKSSVSKEDALRRLNTYGKVFSRYSELREVQRQFSGYAETNLLSNQYFNASVSSYVNSFAGFIAIERDMDQSTALLSYMDLVGVSDGRSVLPNLGTENLSGIRNNISMTLPLSTGQSGYTYSTGKKLVPGTVKIVLNKIVGGVITQTATIVDDRGGNLISSPGILDIGSGPERSAVNYLTGFIGFTLGSGFSPANGDVAIVTANQDSTGEPVTGGADSPYNNRFKTELKNIIINSTPDMLIAESNLVSLAAMQKSLGINAADFTAQKLTELYTKLINQRMVGEITNKYTGATTTSELGKINAFQDYRSAIDKFTGDLITIDSALAVKSVKGTQATAYLVGTGVAEVFRKTAITGLWADNVDATYINDLLGYYKGIPVLRHTDVGTNDGYALHKTIDGNLAPVMRGIYLPLTNTPAIGNYNNPTQVATGVFYQEGVSNVTNDLVQKFTVQYTNA